MGSDDDGVIGFQYGYGYGNSNSNNGNDGNGNDGGEMDYANAGQWSCCNDSQTLFILLYIAFIVIAILTWNTLLAKPIRLIAVFVHEFCHAIACWLSCGSVRKIEVHENEGGVTTFVGGCRSFIIPAGYVGCSIWSMFFVILSGGRVTATLGCAFFTMMLIGTLCYNPNRVLMYLALAYTLLNITVVMIDYYVYSPILQFLILYYGVTIGMYSIADIYEDTVVREHKGSDAYACSAEVWPCCYSRWVGITWATLAVIFQVIGISIALVAMSEECQNLTWATCFDWSIDEGFDWGGGDMDFEGWWHQATKTFQWNQNA
jgi:Peptidase M50B-like